MKTSVADALLEAQQGILDGSDIANEALVAPEVISTELDMSTDPTLTSMYDEQMNYHDRDKPRTAPMLIRYSGLRPNAYRVYLRASHMFDSEYVNKLCRFLSNLKVKESVTFYLGSNLHSSQLFRLGGLITAIRRCQATVHAVALGCCGLPETLIFVFAHHRTMRKYSALTVGGVKDIEHLPMYNSFMKRFLEKVRELYIIDSDQYNELWSLRHTLLITAEEYHARTTGK